MLALDGVDDNFKDTRALGFYDGITASLSSKQLMGRIQYYLLASCWAGVGR